MLIGLSVSGCISDIVEGKVNLNDVAYIIGGIDPTLGDTQGVNDGLLEIIDAYTENQWADYPENAIDLFTDLWNGGRILCPRMAVQKHDDFSNIPIPALLVVNPGEWWLGCEVINGQFGVEETFERPEWA